MKINPNFFYRVVILFLSVIRKILRNIRNKYNVNVLKIKLRNKINHRELKKQKHESMVKNMEIFIQEIEAELKRTKEKD